jgi:hypothetical protein
VILVLATLAFCETFRDVGGAPASELAATQIERMARRKLRERAG